MDHFPITETQVKFYEENGYIQLHNVLSAAEVADLRTHVDQAIADVNAKNKTGGTPLHEAAMQGRLDVARILLDRGAQVNAVSAYNTPLHLAARAGHQDLVALLVARGADVQAREHRGLSPLDEAIALPGDWTPARTAIVTLLLQSGADLRGSDGRTTPPLHQAVRRGNATLAELLLAHGADINARDEHGRTALHWAVSDDRMEMVELLGIALHPPTGHAMRCRLDGYFI